MDPQLQDFGSEEDTIAAYFQRGYSYKKITIFLRIYHNINLSVRTLKRRLATINLRRKNNDYDLPHVKCLIDHEITNGNLSGYRLMCQSLQNKYAVTVPREVVRRLMNDLDPGGVQQRRSRRLHRRLYSSPGPNFCWHVDGYDKLKPYGFAINGCIDGFSRRILWLEVGSSNSDPAIITSYFLDCISTQGKSPRNLRTDCGTENVNIAAIQEIMSLEGRHFYGTSQANQRIECWWSFLIKNRSRWWIDFFSDLSNNFSFEIGNNVQTDILRFCFMEILQQELNDVVSLWNSHRIRKSNYSRCPHGKPDELYFLPSEFNASDFSIPVVNDVVTACYQWSKKKQCCMAGDFENYLTYIMELNNLSNPSNTQSATELYFYLKGVIH